MYTVRGFPIPMNVLRAVSVPILFISLSTVQADPALLGLALFEDIGSGPTILLRSDALQRQLADHLKADHGLEVILLEPEAAPVRGLPDPNTQLLPLALRSGGWRNLTSVRKDPDWLDLGRRQGAEVVVTGTFEDFGPELRFFAEGVDPLTKGSLFMVKVEGATEEKFDLLAQLADRIASQMNLRELEKAPIAGVAPAVEKTTPLPPVSSEETSTAEDHYESGFALARRYDQTKDPELLEGAAEEYRAALAKDPNHFRALNNLGTVLHRMGKYEEALEYYNRVLQVEPTYVRAMENAALASRSVGKTSQAIEFWRKALEYEDRENIRQAIIETLEKLEAQRIPEQTGPTPPE